MSYLRVHEVMSVAFPLKFSGLCGVRVLQQRFEIRQVSMELMYIWIVSVVHSR